MTFYQYLKSHSEKDPKHPAIIEGDTTLSYGEFVSQIERFASALSKLKLTANSKIGLLCLNQKEYLVAYFAALVKGIPVIPYNFMLKPEDLVYITQDARIDTLVVDSAFVKPETVPFFKLFPNKILAGPADPSQLGEGTLRWEEFMVMGDPRDSLTRHKREEILPDVILYTSGTTAKPKGVMLEEKQFDANCTGFLQHLHFNCDDKVIVALPLFHSFGNIMALVLLRSGATLILLKQFQPKTILESISRHQATILPLVPTIYSFLVQLYARGGYDISSLRYCISGGASLPEALLKKVEEGLGVTVIEGYGLTETSPVIAVNTMKDGSVAGSVGPILPNVELEIVDDAGKPVPQGEVGEIRVRGETVMQGYWKKPKETEETLTADGWLKTGDLGHMDEKGRLFISAGRIKDLIIRAGENVSPLAIENALMNHPAVIEVAAVGIPDERVGEKVKVFVALREGTRTNEQKLKELCREKLPAFMIPDKFQFMESLPKTATGKILKSELRAMPGDNQQ
ncbi:MAG: long-chain fatty acid--CoA ligase [Nitrospinae bacterium]|nr:long-chain fatty acid--CoA ligase [Nitrospinota bacterium]